MMALAQQKMTLAEFLAWENDLPERHEYFRGEVFAMVGARRSHEVIVSNLIRHIGNRLDGTPCLVLGSNMKLQIADDTILYPDVQVTCSKADRAADIALTAPTIIIEVLSPSTQSYDRSQKFALYRRIASLQEYILFDPDTRRVEAFRREPGERWVFFDMSQDEALLIPAIDCRIPLALVFQGIDPAT